MKITREQIRAARAQRYYENIHLQDVCGSLFIALVVVIAQILLLWLTNHVTVKGWHGAIQFSLLLFIGAFSATFITVSFYRLKK